MFRSFGQQHHPGLVIHDALHALLHLRGDSFVFLPLLYELAVGDALEVTTTGRDPLPPTHHPLGSQPLCRSAGRLTSASAWQDEVTPPFSRLLASTGIHFQQGEVLAVDPASRTATIKPHDDTPPYAVGAAHTLPAYDDRRTAEPRWWCGGGQGSAAARGGESVVLPYDRLVVALGSEPTSTTQAVPGAAEHAMTFYR